MIFKSMCDCMKTLMQVILENIKCFFTVYIYTVKNHFIFSRIFKNIEFIQ